ncbi:MAG: DUF4270 family protein [Tidjanibacter sp.]|nr:DUF4270 family protein [Tidjanibacter sp.]
MKKFLNHRFPVAGTVVVALIAILTCCTKVEYDMGGNLIPNGQNMKVKFNTLTGNVHTYNTISDYHVSSHINLANFGKAKSDDLGKTKAGSIFQYTYYYRNDGNFEKGTNYTPDSTWLFTNMSYFGGDSLKEQTFYIYEVTQELFPDSVYTTSLDYTEMINPTPMFSFTYSGQPIEGNMDTLKLKVEDETLAKEYMTKLGTVDSVYYYIDTLMPANFYGMCIMPADSSPEDAAIYGMNLAYDNGSYLRTYGHNYKIDDPSAIQDTIIRTYTLCDDLDYYNNVSINFIKHDYEGTGITPVQERMNDLGAPVSTSYIQGMAGVATTIEFDENFMTELKALCPEGYDMVINQARIRLPLKTKTAEKFNGAPERIGAYLDYGSLNNTIDYYYAYLDYITYDGFLNRSNGWYSINVEFHLQKMLEKSDYSSRITLGMPYTHVFKSLEEVALIGSAEQDVNVEITYTLINKPD